MRPCGAPPACVESGVPQPRRDRAHGGVGEREAARMGEPPGPPRLRTKDAGEWPAPGIPKYWPLPVERLVRAGRRFTGAAPVLIGRNECAGCPGTPPSIAGDVADAAG